VKRPIAAIVASAFAILVLGGTSATAPASDAFAVATAPYAFSFPADDGAHPRFESEWWRLFGRVRTPSGRPFSYELTFFRFAVGVGAAQFYPATFSVTDEAGNVVHRADRVGRDGFGTGAAREGSLSVRVDPWSLAARSREGVPPRWASRASGTDAAIDLVHSAEKAPVVHGVDGTLRVGPCRSCALHSSSYTRLRTHGTLRIGGVSFIVDGTSWLDHEFGSDAFAGGYVGWDRFSFVFDDGRELLLMLPRRRFTGADPLWKPTPESSGTLIARNGTARHLDAYDFTLEVRGGTTWTSPDTGASYPAIWRIGVPSAGIDVAVAPLVANQEHTSRTSGGSPYWNGAVEVRDASNDGVLLGWGRAELTGYARPLSL
jgi:predicted secreted hydrolase